MSRLLALSLLTWDSAMSARSSASSNSCCTLRNLDRLVLACSSCEGVRGWKDEGTGGLSPQPSSLGDWLPYVPPSGLDLSSVTLTASSAWRL